MRQMRERWLRDYNLIQAASQGTLPSDKNDSKLSESCAFFASILSRSLPRTIISCVCWWHPQANHPQTLLKSNRPTSYLLRHVSQKLHSIYESTHSFHTTCAQDSIRHRSLVSSSTHQASILWQSPLKNISGNSLHAGCEHLWRLPLKAVHLLSIHRLIILARDTGAVRRISRIMENRKPASDELHGCNKSFKPHTSLQIAPSIPSLNLAAGGGWLTVDPR